jgi:hypothetical protein|tara:strand:- start:4 stop:129 length:126 start_codon:yes stop_codon:yes gene_type:complete
MTTENKDIAEKVINIILDNKTNEANRIIMAVPGGIEPPFAG